MVRPSDAIAAARGEIPPDDPRLRGARAREPSPVSTLPWNLRIARRLRRLALPLALLGAVALWWRYGVLTVPEGMDTMPESHPPGTRCLIEKRPRAVRAGAVVFVDVPGGTLLGRVARVQADGAIALAFERAQSRFAEWQDEELPATAIRGLVLVAFVPEPEAPVGVPRGR